MVEERLKELEEREEKGLDASAKGMLRKTDPDIAMEALNQWESSEMWTRNNPSACMVKLLKRLLAQGQEVGTRKGLIEDDDQAKEAAEELLEALGDKIDGNAREALEALEAWQALGILQDIEQQADGIRKPSAFVMSAAKRIQAGQGSAGSRRKDRDPPRLQEGPYADRGYDDRQENSYGRHRGADRGNGYDQQSYGYGSYSSDYGQSQYSKREASRRGYGKSEQDKVDELMKYLDLDETAKTALATIPPDRQVELLEELSQDSGRVRNHSAFICSNVKRVKEGTYRSRKQEDEGDSYPPQHSYGDYGSHYGSNSYDAGYAQEGPESSFAWSKLDEKAQGEVLALSKADAAHLMNDLESKIQTLRNASAFVCSAAKRYSKNQETRSYRYDEPARSRSPRGGATRPSSDAFALGEESALPPETEEEAEQQKQQIDEYLNSTEGERVLDHKARDELRKIPPHEALNLMLKIGANDIRNPSAFVTKACREILKNVERESFSRQVANGSHERPPAGERPTSRPTRAAEAQSDLPGEEDWRSMPLDQWLRKVDNGGNYLLQYESALLANFDSVEQIMSLYVSSGEDGKIVIDKLFFDDLKVEKMGHKRLFEKWFKERWGL